MAKATVKTERKILLELTVQEATFIRTLVQNPMNHPGHEPADERTMRESIFNALQNPTQEQ